MLLPSGAEGLGRESEQRIQPRKVKERGDGDCPLAPLARVRSEKSLHARLHLIEAHPPARAVSRSRSDSRRPQTVRTARATVGQISEQLAFLNSSSRHRLPNLLRSAAPLRAPSGPPVQSSTEALTREGVTCTVASSQGVSHHHAASVLESGIPAAQCRVSASTPPDFDKWLCRLRSLNPAEPSSLRAALCTGPPRKRDPVWLGRPGGVSRLGATKEKAPRERLCVLNEPDMHINPPRHCRSVWLTRVSAGPLVWRRHRWQREPSGIDVSVALGPPSQCEPPLWPETRPRYPFRHGTLHTERRRS
jgi:hypothetical protein